MKLRAALFVPLLGTLGCWVPKQTGEVMQREIHALQAQQAASQKGLAEQQARLEEQMQRADRKIEEVARTLDDLNRAARSTDADFGVRIERLIKELQELRGSIELTEYRLGKIEAKLEGEGSLEARVKGLEEQASAPPPAPREKEAPKGRKELLAHAASLVKEGKTADARGVYRDVVKQWPGEQGVTDEAYFRLGETYYSDRKCQSAVQEYIKVVEKFAGGAYADDAYYKIGLCSAALGNLEDAKIFFTEIVRNHKKSPLAKDAQKQLDEVEKRLAKETRARKPAKK